MRYVWAKSVRFDFLLNQNAALVDGGGKIFLSPRKWETDLRWASDISRCVVEPNLSFWEHVTKAHRLYTAALNPHICFVHFSMLCPLSYVGYLQDYSKSKKIDFENALRATVLKIQPCALVGISFSHQAVPVANLGQIRQHHIFLKFSHFNAAKSSLGGISTKKRESALKLCRLVALLPLNGFWPDISLFLRLVLAFEKAP